MTHCKCAANLAFGRIFTFDVKLHTIRCPNCAIRKVEGDIWCRVFADIVIVLELVKVFARCHHIVASAVAFECVFSLKGPGNQRSGGYMVLVREGYTRDVTLWRSRIDKDSIVSVDKTLPLEVERNVLGGGDHVRVHGLLAFSLPANNLEKSRHGLLDCLDQVGFELLKRVLHREKVMTVVVLFNNLFVEAVVNTALDDVRIV